MRIAASDLRYPDRKAFRAKPLAVTGNVPATFFAPAQSRSPMPSVPLTGGQKVARPHTSFLKTPVPQVGSRRQRCSLVVGRFIHMRVGPSSAALRNINAAVLCAPREEGWS